MKPIFCIGEVKEEREANKQNEVVKAQLEGSVFNLSAEDFGKLVLAYEPVWAIGTGMTATSDQAEEMHAYIRRVIGDKFGDHSDRIPILYGGSCKPSNEKNNEVLLFTGRGIKIYTIEGSYKRSLPNTNMEELFSGIEN